MVNADRKSFVEDITLAARWLGIRMSIFEEAGQYRCDWFDPMTYTTINGTISDTKETAYESACHALVKYLSTK